MKMSQPWIASALLVVAAAAPTGCMVDPPPFKAAFLLPGPAEDLGWNYAHEQGRQGVTEADETDVAFNVNPADIPDLSQGYVDQGYSAIFAASFDYREQAQEVSAANPSVPVMVCNGWLVTEGVGSYYGRQYQPYFLAGLLAAKVSGSGKIGVVAPVNIAQTTRQFNAIALGVQAAGEGDEVRVLWTKDWIAPELEELYALRLVAWGADVVVSQSDTTKVANVVEDIDRFIGERCAWYQDDPGQEVDPTKDLVAAECEALYALSADEKGGLGSIASMNQDACDGFESCLSSVYFHWAPLYDRIIAAMKERGFEPTEVWEQMKESEEESVTGLAQINDRVDEEIRTEIGNWKTHLAKPSHVAYPFVAPLDDPDGEIVMATLEDTQGNRLSQGALTDEDLKRMCWYVAGISELSDPIDPRCDGGDDHLPY